MSLSSHDRFTAVLCPDRVALVRRPRGWRKDCTLHDAEACPVPTAQAAADALRGLLARTDSGRAELTLLLSNHFMHYVLVPWRAQVAQPAELQAFASVCLDETFGSESGSREVRVARERAPSARVAAAVDNTLLKALRSAVAGSRLRLTSIQPYLPAAFDHLRAHFGARDFLFLLAEPARSCLLLAKDGCWRSLRNIAAVARPHELAHLIEREAQLAGLADEGMPPVFVHAPGQERLVLPACHGVTPRTLPLPAGPAQDPLLAMAMVVA